MFSSSPQDPSNHTYTLSVLIDIYGHQNDNHQKIRALSATNERARGSREKRERERYREREMGSLGAAQGALRLKSLTRSWSSSALPATISPFIGRDDTQSSRISRKKEETMTTRDDIDVTTTTLRDVTVGVKDIFDLEEHVCGFGSPAFKTQFPQPAESDAAAVTALRQAGAVGFAPLHMDEMAFSLFGENANMGTPINYKSPSRVPGGSSSGCGSAVAGGLVDIALGSDTAGSIRVPASFCGAWGFRPTHGRVSVRGSRALAHSLDTVGLVARNAELLETGMKVLLDTVPDGRKAVSDDEMESILGGTTT